MDTDLYQPDGFYRCCERCGWKVRAYNTKKEWTGLIVCKRCWDPKHPQEFVRGRYDPQNVPDPRPEATDRFLGTNEVTADSL